MKRSEALKIIVKELNDQLGVAPSLNTSCVAHDILFRLEEAGMQPPTCRVFIKDGKHTPTERKWDEEE